MQCARFEQRLQQLLDDRCDVYGDKILRQHAELCAKCQSVLKTQSTLFSVIGELSEFGDSIDLGHQVLDSMLVEQRRRSKRRITMAVLAITAVLVIALAPLAGRRPAAIDGKLPGNSTLAMALPGTTDVSQNHLSQEEAEDIRILMRHFVRRVSDPRFEMFSSVDQLASGIRPLAVTFNYALNTLRRRLPGYSNPQPVEPQAVLQKLHVTIGSFA